MGIFFLSILSIIVPEHVRTITSATYQAVDTDQEIILHRLKDTAPEDDCFLCNDQERTTSYETPLPQTHQPVIHRGKTVH